MDLHQIKVGDEIVKVKSKKKDNFSSFNSILDSGTTYSYFEPELFFKMQLAFSKYC